MHSGQLLNKYPITTDQMTKLELGVLLRELEMLLQEGREGSIVELGCYKGTTALFIRRLLNAYTSHMEFHVYDSFAGLPPKTAKDNSAAGEQFTTGELVASKKDVLLAFKKAGLVPPNIHKVWFNQLQPTDIPNNVQFAFLDGDYYESIRDSLAAIEDKLSPGAVIIIDDYANEALPGAAKATDEWLKSHAYQRFRVESSLAVIRMP